MDNRILVMSTTKLAALVLIVVGGVLLYFGYSASQSALESITETVTGRFSDQTTMYLVGGAACAVLGVGLLLFGKK
jgi:type IV secretory pathway VirB2 component (pilin)